jgi:signal transduction histidine kinase
VDARGRPARLDGEITPLLRAGREVAFLSHRPGLLDDPALVDEVSTAARLALENERLQAETRAQLEELRASRIRIIETGDAERRRLERDLHDGTQQRLVALALDIRLARLRLGADGDAARLRRVDEAEDELRLALGELRELARGIFPAVLAEEGLAAALEALEEELPGQLWLRSVTATQAGLAAEAAAYFVVAETLKSDPATRHEVAVVQRDGRLVVEIEGERSPQSVVELEDRVGALDGSVDVLRRRSGGVTLRAEIPCAS